MYLATAVARYSSHLAAAIKVGRRPAARNPGGSAAHRPQSRWRFEILDPTGEWSRRCPGFMQKMTDNNIDVRSKPVNVDKHGLGKGEMAVQITKMHMQAIMLSTRLAEDIPRRRVTRGADRTCTAVAVLARSSTVSVV